MGQDAADLQAKNVRESLRAGIAAAKAGQRERARDLLMRVVEQDEENVLAWLWLSGVVDSLDDRQVCLENVLTLDPDNVAARRGLDWVCQQKEAQAPLSAEAAPPARAEAPPASTPESPVTVHARTSISPAAAILHEDLTRRQPQPEPELEQPPRVARDEFDDEYLCPYCATQTQPEDRKCGACGGDLWIRFRRREKRSPPYWTLLLLQFYSTCVLGVVPLLMLIYVGLRVTGALALMDVSAPLALLDVYSEFPTPVEIVRAALSVMPLFVFLLSALLCLFSFAVFIGFCLRWRPVYYVMMADAVWGLIAAVVAMILTHITAFGAISVVLMLVRLLLVFQVEDAFQWDRRRIVLCIDRGLSSSVDFVIRGDHYAKRKMWAMVAIHLRRAAGMLPNEPECRVALALAYIRLKRYERAAQVLAEAGRISPANPRVGNLRVLLDEMCPTGNQP